MTMIISEGTLRPQDLIPVFYTALKEVTNTPLGKVPAGVSPDLIAEYLDHQDEAETAILADGDYWMSESPQWLLEELFDALNSAAPEGEYFGNSEGDGACFGFFEYSEDTE